MTMDHPSADARHGRRAPVRDHGARPSGAHGHRPLPEDAAELDVAARLFHALADPGRLRILAHLQLGEPGTFEQRVVDLTAHLGLAQSTVSAHLACLRDCGLLEVRHEGRASWYRLARPERTDALLRAGQALLAGPQDGVR